MYICYKCGKEFLVPAGMEKLVKKGILLVHNECI